VFPTVIGILVQAGGGVARSVPLIRKGQDRGQRQPRRRRSPTARERRCPNDTLELHDFQEATGVIAGAAIRSAHIRVKIASGSKIEGAHLGRPRFGAPPLREMTGVRPRLPNTGPRDGQVTGDFETGFVLAHLFRRSQKRRNSPDPAPEKLPAHQGADPKGQDETCNPRRTSRFRYKFQSDLPDLSADRKSEPTSKPHRSAEAGEHRVGVAVDVVRLAGRGIETVRPGLIIRAGPLHEVVHAIGAETE